MFRKWKKISVGAAFLFVLSSSVFAFSDSQLQELLAQIDAAAETRDASKVSHLLSDEVSVVIEMPTPQGNMRLDLNKQQYLEMLQQGWNAVGPSYKYTRLTTDMESDGKRAQVVSIVREEFQMAGQVVSSDTLETTDFAVENGRLVAVKVVGQVHVQGQPIPKPSI